MDVPLFDLAAQNAAADVSEVVENVIRSGQYILGDEVASFEAAVRQRLGADVWPCAVASGTDALVIALRVLGVGESPERQFVLVPALTFVATGQAVARVGATPLFVDVDNATFNIDVASAAHAIERVGRTSIAAIVGVDLFGEPFDRLLYDLGFPVVEDAAQAFGAFRVRPCSEVGAASASSPVAFSFFPTKPLGGVGDGGMVVFATAEQANRAAMLRHHGCRTKNYAELLGYNSRLDALQAAVLKKKLPFVRKWQQRRCGIAQEYRRVLALRGGPGVSCQLVSPGTAAALFAVRFVNQDKRDRAAARLRSAGIACGVYYPHSVPDQPAFFARSRAVNCPVARALCGQLLCVPCHDQMTDAQVEYVGNVLATFS